MAKPGWQPVSTNCRCPVCDGPDNCTVSVDGQRVWCGRRAEGSVRQNNGGQFLHIVCDAKGWSNPTARTDHPSHRHARQKKLPTKGCVDFEAISLQAYNRTDAPQRRAELAKSLGVSVTALERLRVGCWSSGGATCWLFSERDAQGRVIGLNRRYANGEKKAWANSERGLLYCDDWHKYEGPVFLVEGPSDTAALLSLECCVVGRPNNTGGVDYLCKLLADVPPERELIVIGENDRKSHADLRPKVRARHLENCEGCSYCWPGLFGAKQTAARLADTLQRQVKIAMPPVGCKDAREVVVKAGGVT